MYGQPTRNIYTTKPSLIVASSSAILFRHPAWGLGAPSASFTSSMEVVGAIASVGAILSGTQKAFRFLKAIPEIEKEWKTLDDEVGVKFVLPSYHVFTFCPRGAPTEGLLQPASSPGGDLKTDMNLRSVRSHTSLRRLRTCASPVEPTTYRTQPYFA